MSIRHPFFYVNYLKGTNFCGTNFCGTHFHVFLALSAKLSSQNIQIIARPRKLVQRDSGIGAFHAVNEVLFPKYVLLLKTKNTSLFLHSLDSRKKNLFKNFYQQKFVSLRYLFS